MTAKTGSKAASKTTTWVLMGGIAAVVLGGGTMIVRDRTARAKDPSAPPAEYSVASLKAEIGEPGRLMEKLRDAAHREDLTDDQRRQIGRNMRDVMQTVMRERMDEYFTASEEDKNKILDRHIDEWQAQMERWERERQEAEKRGEDQEGSMRRMFGPGTQTQEERKAQAESRNPDQMAKAMSYFMAVQKRMSERGMKMPWGRGGPGGRRPGRGP
jgi:hypothetical protein